MPSSPKTLVVFLAVPATLALLATALALFAWHRQEATQPIPLVASVSAAPSAAASNPN